MPLNRLIQENDNPDLTEERLRATFDTDELAAVVKGGRQNLLHVRRLREEVSKRPGLQDERIVAHMSRPEKYENSSRKMCEMNLEAPKFSDRLSQFDSMHIVRDVMGVEGYPLAIHWMMFLPTLENQLDEEQTTWWWERAVKGEIIGTYAQSEMGHGTNLGKIETEAVYDFATEEFVLNSPTVTSLKWWPGGLGNTVNHVVLVANLKIRDKNHGPHIFFVQIRDMETHKPMPGVRVGDIGAKMGIKAVDNGFLGLDHYRIPRRNMLMKHAKVDKDGTYHAPVHTKVTYSTMTYVRAEIVLMTAMYLMCSTIISIRYSCVRRQGEVVPGAGEVRVLDYETQQNRLFPHLAKAFAYQFAGNEVQNMTADCLNKMKTNNVDTLADLHAISCCLKAFVTFEGCQGIEQCRMSCGGHGYSEASYFPTLYGCAVAGCTYEGDNLVMLLQTARYLMRAAKSAREGKSVGPSVDFLLQPSQKFSLIDRKPTGDYSHYLLDFEHIARKQIFKAFDRLEALKANGRSAEVAWSENGVEMNRASRAYARLFIARTFFDCTKRVVDANARGVLEDLLHLHFNHELLSRSKYLQEDGYATSGQMQYVKDDLYRLYGKVRPNAVSIVDSFDIGDRELRSVLGRRDGHVYENLYKWALASPLNQHPDGVNPTFHKYLKPMMKGEKAKL